MDKSFYTLFSRPNVQAAFLTSQYLGKEEFFVPDGSSVIQKCFLLRPSYLVYGAANLLNIRFLIIKNEDAAYAAMQHIQ